MVNQTAVLVDASDYVRNHGASPRGGGSWAFCTVDTRAHDYLDFVIWVNASTYGAARRAAVQVVRGKAIDPSVLVRFGPAVASRLAQGDDVSVLYVCS